MGFDGFCGSTTIQHTRIDSTDERCSDLQRYHIVTIYVDHFSDFTYIHLQQSTTSAETLQSKHEFEHIALSYGVNIIRYHSDNGRFADNAWMNDVKLIKQGSSMCGVNAHHQNGKAERRIRQLQYMTRTLLLQACTMWPDAINLYLWPYALRKSADDLNRIAHQTEEHSPMAKFAKVKIKPDMSTHLFGCPTFVLNSELQAGNNISKREV
jgi:hypothetical protein